MAGSTGLEPAASGVTGANADRDSREDLRVYSAFVRSVGQRPSSNDTVRHGSARESGTPTGTVAI